MSELKNTWENIGGEVVKDNSTYLLTDNRLLNNLVLSKTILHMNQSTTGHSHPGLEEVYFFVAGWGTMEVGEKKMDVTAGDIVLIPDGEFHRVHNTSDSEGDLEFICVFQSYVR